MAEKYGDKAAVLKLNVGNKGEVATMAMDEYKITKTPILKFYLNGKEVKELVGAQSEEELDVIFIAYFTNMMPISRRLISITLCSRMYRELVGICTGYRTDYFI